MVAVDPFSFCLMILIPGLILGAVVITLLRSLKQLHRPKNRSGWARPALLGCLSALAAAFCFGGAVMDGSFAVAGVTPAASREYVARSDLWFVGACVLALAACVFFVFAWRRRHST